METTRLSKQSTLLITQLYNSILEVSKMSADISTRLSSVNQESAKVQQLTRYANTTDWEYSPALLGIAPLSQDLSEEVTRLLLDSRREQALFLRIIEDFSSLKNLASASKTLSPNSHTSDPQTRSE